MFHLLALTLYIIAVLISQAQSIEDQVPEESSIATYLTKLPSVWFNVWKFLDQQQPVTSSQKSSKVKSASKKQLTFRRRRLPRKRPRPGPLRNEAEEKQFFIAPPPPPVPGRFPIFFRRRPLSIFTRLALGAQVFYSNLAFLGGWHCPCKIDEQGNYSLRRPPKLIINKNIHWPKMGYLQSTHIHVSSNNCQKRHQFAPRFGTCMYDPYTSIYTIIQ